jgi:hypothetical protein
VTRSGSCQRNSALHSPIEDGLPWLAPSPLDASLSTATLATEKPRDALRDRYPAIALRSGDHLSARVHLALLKHATTTTPALAGEGPGGIERGDR